MKKLLKEYIKERARRLKRPICVSLLGFGSTNKSILDALLGSPDAAKITVRNRTAVPLPSGVTPICGADHLADMWEDVFFASPSLRREELKLPDGSEITSDTEIFFESVEKDLFLISGSDGKSTTTTLSSLLLAPAFPRLFTGGNLGIPVASASLLSDAFVLELSSFNLRYSAPRGGRALITNLTPNHLDWHKDFQEYMECKLRLLDSADEPIISLSCPALSAVAEKKESFALVSDTMTSKEIRASYRTEHTVTLEGDNISIDANPVINVSEVARNEKHNLRNLMSAIAMSIGYTSRERIREVALSFCGLEHRCEGFTCDGIDFINSSIDTTPDRARVTLESLGRRATVILGGRGKGLSPDPLRDPLIKYAERIIVYGEVAGEMIEWIDSDRELSLIPHTAHGTLGDAIDSASVCAKRGDTVIFAPAATSYGEFSSYAERGAFFKSQIEKIYRKI